MAPPRGSNPIGEDGKHDDEPKRNAEKPQADSTHDDLLFGDGAGDVPRPSGGERAEGWRVPAGGSDDDFMNKWI